MAADNERNDECIDLYFKELEHIKPLSKEDEGALIQRYKKYNDIEARNKLITSNLKYAASIASKFVGNGVPYSDLIAEANNGLIEAIDKFDTDYDVKFLTYSKWWIIASIQQSINRGGNRVFNKASPIEYKIKDDNDDELYGNDCIFNKYEDESIESPKPEYIASLLQSLTDIERQIITLQYGIGQDKAYKFSEISDMIGMGRERIRQISNKAMRKIRSHVMTNL